MNEAFVAWQHRFSQEPFPVVEQLRAAVTRWGRVPPNDLERIAEEAGRPVAAVTGTSSFYADLNSGRGRRHVRVCEGTSCFVSSGGRSVDTAESVLAVARGGCSRDGSVSLQPVHCLGYCYASPAALDDDQPRTGPRIDEQLTRQPRSADTAPPIPYTTASSRSVTLAGLTGEEAPWSVWPDVLTRRLPEEVRAEVAAAGLRGRGGAEFPVATKWRSAARGEEPRFVVANGDEGDPGSYCDRLLMENDPHRVLEGLALACFAVGAHDGFVFVRSEYSAAAAQLRTAVAEASSAGHLGQHVHGSSFDLHVRIVDGAGSYVAGEETALLHALEGLRGSVRPRPPYPTDRGFAHHPTVINNVETLAAVPWVLRHGGTAYARLGTPEETGTKLVCLSQLFRNPGVYEVELGVPLRFLVEELGGGLRDGRALRAVQVGGPLGGFLAPDEAGTPLSAGALAERGVALGHGSIVAIDGSVSADDLLHHVWTFAEAESCGACTPCRVGTRRGLELVERDSGEHLLECQDRLLEVLATGSLCAFGRGVPGAVRSLVRVYEDELR